MIPNHLSLSSRLQDDPKDMPERNISWGKNLKTPQNQAATPLLPCIPRNTLQ